MYWWEEIKKCCRHVCTRIGIFTCFEWLHKKCTSTVCVWRCDTCRGCGNDLFFPHYATAYVWFIYIHGYPDNEAFNPGDPVVRTMNPITSCRLWDGMADSETDGRGCTRPAIQSHSSHLLPVSPVHVFCSNLSTGRGQTMWDHYITHINNFCRHIPWGPLDPTTPRSPVPHSHHTPQVPLFLQTQCECQLEEVEEVSKGFCRQGNTYLNIEPLIN